MSFNCVCGKEYKTQRGYDNHVKTCKRAASAAPSAAPPSTSNLPEIAAAPAGLTPTVAGLTTLFTRFENLLYSEGTVAEKAREDIISLMIIRLLEPKFISGEIDVMDIEKNAYSRLVTAENIKHVRMSVLAELPKEDIMGELSRIWKSVLSVHEVTREIFKSDRYLSVRSDAILAAMVRDLAKFDFESLPPDCLAEVYQHFIHKQFKGEKSSRLGQHFTPGAVVRHIVDTATEYIPPGATICDPFCGTGGFLLAAYEKMRADGRNPVDYIYGTEIDIDVFRYAIANLLITSGKVCTGIKNKSAFDKHARKYGAIFTNPPFGSNIQKGSIESSWFAQTATNVRNLLCLQMCMTLLDEGGICSMVFPAGTELSTQKGAAAEIRKRLCDEYELISITYLPKKTFEYTDIGTVIITFRAGVCTNKPVQFYNYVNGARELVREVDVETLEEKGFSFSAADYVVRTATAAGHGFEIKKLGEVATIEIGGTPLRKEDSYWGGPNVWVTVSELNNCLITDSKEKITDDGVRNSSVKLQPVGTILMSFKLSIGKMAIAGVNLYTNEAIACINSKDVNKVTNKYLYYYYKFNSIEQYARGAIGAGNLNKEILNDLPISIPSLARQTEIVAIIDKMEETRGHLAAAINGVKFEIDASGKHQFTNISSNIKKLGSICAFKKGTGLVKNDMVSGEYPVIGAGQTPTGFHNEFNRDENTIFVSCSGAYAGYVSFQPTKSFATDCFTVHPGTEINNKYLYYWLKTSQQEHIYSLQKGAAQPHIYSSMLEEFEIPIPPLEAQERITSHLDKLYKKLATLTALAAEQANDAAETFNTLITQG